MSPGAKALWLADVARLGRPTVTHVATVLATILHDGQTGKCRPRLAAIAEAAGLGLRATRAALDTLAAEGLIQRKRFRLENAGALRTTGYRYRLIPATAPGTRAADQVAPACHSRLPTYKKQETGEHPDAGSPAPETAAGPAIAVAAGLARALRPSGHRAQPRAAGEPGQSGHEKGPRPALRTNPHRLPEEVTIPALTDETWDAVLKAWGRRDEAGNPTGRHPHELDTLERLFRDRLGELGADPLASALPRPGKGVPPSLNAAVLAAIAEREPEWFELHPPGSLVTGHGRPYLVPAYNPAVATDTDAAALEAILAHARRLAAAAPGPRLDALNAARRRFPKADGRLMRPDHAHELARAEYIALRLPAVKVLRPSLDLDELRRQLEWFGPWPDELEQIQPNPDRVVEYDHTEHVGRDARGRRRTAPKFFAQVEALEAVLGHGVF